MTLKASCGNCNAWLRQQGKVGACRARPPVPIMVGMSQGPALVGLPKQGLQATINSVFPSMQENGWCREWEPTTAMEGEFMKAARDAREINGQQAEDEAQTPPAA